VRLFAATALLLVLVNCGEPPAPQAEHDETTDQWYIDDVKQMVDATQKGEAFFRDGKQDEASSLILQAETASDQVLAVPRPTLAAMQAASDLDSLYGRMLLANRHYGWARFLFQKNVARWRTWKPESDDTKRRLTEAQAQIDECDKAMEKSASRTTHPK
jgi:hypothetical protein